MRRLPRTLPLALLPCLLIVAASALAQSALEQVDPDAVQGRTEELPTEALVVPARRAVPVEAPAPPIPAAAAKPTSLEVVPAIPGVRPAPPAVVVPSVGDEALLAAWNRGAWKDLIALKEELGASNLEPFSIALARASDLKLNSGDPAGGVALAATAVELSPDLPYAHLALASAYLRAEPSEVGRWGGELVQTLRHVASDPRFLRPALADLFGALIAAMLATAAAVVGVLFARNVRYFVHDFHHLFPRAAMRWQTAPLAILVLAMPWVFRLGALPVLLVLFASVALYLGRAERIVGTVALLMAALLPAVAGWAASATSFAGTPAEEVYLLERGGLEAARAAQKVRARIAEGRVGFEDLFALGRWELRRGRLESASELLKKAAPLADNDARVLTNLGNVRLAVGDLEGAQTLYQQATAANAALAAPHYNLSRVHYRRAATLIDAAEAQELEKAQTAHGNAQALDQTLLARAELPKDSAQPLNRLVISPGLRMEEIAALASAPDLADHVADQLSWRLMDMPEGPLAYSIPVLALLGIVGLGALRSAVSAARACDKCGRPVCRRCDPELSVGGSLCNQCVHVFTRKGIVAPREKLQKQLEVDRFQARQERVSWTLGLVCGGAGHLFAGLPVRGALFAFVSLFFVASLVLHHGVVRAPWGALPLWLRLLPVGAVFLVVYLVSLNSLRKAHTR